MMNLHGLVPTDYPRRERPVDVGHVGRAAGHQQGQDMCGLLCLFVSLFKRETPVFLSGTNCVV